MTVIRSSAVAATPTATTPVSSNSTPSPTESSNSGQSLGPTTNSAISMTIPPRMGMIWLGLLVAVGGGSVMTAAAVDLF
ncbi:hypothetical protein K435DRAFT_300912 [Dendrothele bispora CBS 962.96]|uniref:Uncharacterized protein n=1 Tax=Dendrothele bispora (strain CBS 962.96) TaxID=1314807 RepID=A0A4S8LIS0_DENBC|nr:hypothetical protein K435DRAFT_300912 [Dendrothele bispora CBS 962.96]